MSFLEKNAARRHKYHYDIIFQLKPVRKVDTDLDFKQIEVFETTS